ncbi:MAG: LLM class flavin-dependent oxidoreductase [Corynebacterium sp.]|nr:LLM class flavin-dependent oxidoreductase [Corynebacterium sp.]
MKAFGFLSFGHYRSNGRNFYDAATMLHQAIELAKNADEIGVNGAYFRVHHFVSQASAPIPLLSAIAASTKNIEVGTGVIDMRYENPLYLAEEAGTLDLIADKRVALGISRGAPEAAQRGWEAFGYQAEDPKGKDLARDKFLQFLSAVRGTPQAKAAPYEEQYPHLYVPGKQLPVFPQSQGLDKRIWWGAGTRESAVQAAQDGVNLMSSTLVTEATGQPLSELQAEQMQHYRDAWKEAGHDWTPRVSVSRSVFPIVSATDAQLFGNTADSDSIGYIDGKNATFGRTYAAEPDVLIEQLKNDAAVQAADTLMLTIPNQAGVEVNTSILNNFAKYVAPELGWEDNRQGLVTGYEI